MQKSTLSPACDNGGQSYTFAPKNCDLTSSATLEAGLSISNDGYVRRTPGHAHRMAMEVCRTCCKDRWRLLRLRDELGPGEDFHPTVRVAGRWSGSQGQG